MSFIAKLDGILGLIGVITIIIFINVKGFHLILILLSLSSGVCIGYFLRYVDEFINKVINKNKLKKEDLK